MQVTHKKYATLLLGCLAISMFAFSGCRTGAFVKPDLTKLAFWKKENSWLASKDTPPPPARHFDPAPINGEKKSQGEVVDLNNKQLRSRYKNDISQMRTEIEDAIKGLAEKPIREPYALETDKGENGIASDNSFAAESNAVKSKLEGLSKNADKVLNDAQNDFQSAMSNASKTVNNDFAAKIDAANDMTSGWKQDLAVPNALSQSKNMIDQSFADANKSLSLASDKLADGLKSKAANPSTAWPAQQNFAPTTQSLDRLAQLQAPTFNSSLATGTAGSDPANLLRSTNPPLLPQTTQPLAPQISQSQPPNYSQTPHGGFAPRPTDNNFSPNPTMQSGSTSSQVDFQSANDKSAVVTADSAPESANGFEARVQNHVSEIDIPASVLKRTGSYSPGSVEAIQSGK